MKREGTGRGNFSGGGDKPEETWYNTSHASEPEGEVAWQMLKRAYLEITNVCNLRCDFCPGTRRPPAFMDRATFRLLARRLRPMGILLRDCGNYPGLGPGWYRAAVRAREENAAFLAALKKVKEGKG